MKLQLPKKKSKRVHLWLVDFNRSFKELLANRYPEWKADDYSYSLGVRFYSSVGDINPALEMFKSNPGIDQSLAVRDIILSLLYHNRAKEAIEFKDKFRQPSTNQEQAYVALYLTLNDKENLKTFFQNITSPIILQHCQCHFGIDTRKKLLIEVLNELKQQNSEKPEINEEVFKYLEM